jgi:hypothetical protein
VRTYYEAAEILDADIDLDLPEFVRIDVTEMTVAERDSVARDIIDIMSGRVCELSQHHCYHDENKICDWDPGLPTLGIFTRLGNAVGDLMRKVTGNG